MSSPSQKKFLNPPVGDRISAGGTTGNLSSKLEPTLRQRRKGGAQEVLGRENLVMELVIRMEAREHRVKRRMASYTGWS